jgi:hypothetical protein
MAGQGNAPETMTEQVKAIGGRINVVKGQINAAIASGTNTAELKTQLGILEAQLQAVKVAQKAAQSASKNPSKN